MATKREKAKIHNAMRLAVLERLTEESRTDHRMTHIELAHDLNMGAGQALALLRELEASGDVLYDGFHWVSLTMISLVLP
jgi:hypothetical protein